MYCGALSAARIFCAVLLFYLSQSTSFHWVDTCLRFFCSEVGIVYSKTWYVLFSHFPSLQTPSLDFEAKVFMGD